MLNLPQFKTSELISNGVHFGHRVSRWNPQMASYIYGEHNSTHIIDLQKTGILLNKAMKFLSEIVYKRGRVLFVSTKHQASKIILEEAKRCGQYYINNRWLGGILTNWETVSSSIRRLVRYEELLENKDGVFTKKELLSFERQRLKLERSLGGIRDMGGLPNALFIIDTNKEHIAIKEANKLNIPVVAVLDTNSDPRGIDYPIPGNDDSVRSIAFFCKIISDAIIEAIRADLVRSGINVDEITDLASFERSSIPKRKSRPDKSEFSSDKVVSDQVAKSDDES